MGFSMAADGFDSAACPHGVSQERSKMSRSNKSGKKYGSIPSKLRRVLGRTRRKRYNRIDPENHPKGERSRDSAYERAQWNYL